MELAADLIVLLHLGFIVFVIFGGLLVAKWHWLMWVHVPAALWGAFIAYVGWVCPLTPLENRLRLAAGEESYETSFVQHYLIPIIYPEDLTRTVQIGLGSFVVLVNVLIYRWVWHRWTR